MVEAYDTRAAVKEQIESLGARFVELKLETGDAEDAGGYATAQPDEFYERQGEQVVAERGRTLDGGGDAQNQPSEEQDLSLHDHPDLLGPAVRHPGVVHQGVAAAEGDKFVVRTQLHDLARIDDGNPVGTASGCKSVGDDDGRSSFEDHVERLLDA